jgi:type IV pilus assembly protein PilP
MTASFWMALMCGVWLLAVPSAMAAPAADKPPAAMPKQATVAPPTPSVPSPPVFQFNPKGRPDPFQPFVEAELARKRLAEAKEKRRQQALPLSPLQRLPVEQFRLVGIAGNDRARKAMVQDPAGKYYPLVPGTLIGLNNARVLAIRETSVLLEEPAATKKGKNRQFEMKLRKEGDEGKP